MQKGVADEWIIKCFNPSSGSAVTGAAASITATLYKDGSTSGAATTDVNPTELTAGFYQFAMTSTENNVTEQQLLAPVHSGSPECIAYPAVRFPRPVNFDDLGIEADGDLTKVNTLNGHTPQTGDTFAQLPTNFSSLGISSGGAITNVSLVDVTTSNTDMRGTDNAFLAASAPANFGNLSISTAGNANADVKIMSTSAASTTAGAVWDEILTAGTHNIATSAGRRVRELAGNIVLSGTSTTAGNGSTYINLDADASTTDGAYDPGVISIVGGTGIGQSRQIFEYDGTLKRAYVNRDWKTTPDGTSQYVIYANSGDTHVNEGKAQGGAVTTITLNSLASSDNDAYKNQVVFIVAGTGADQAKVIIGYNGTTKVATVHSAWATNPDSTSIYAVLPKQACNPEDIAAILEDSGTTIPNQISGLNNLSAAEVNAEVDSALNTSIPGSRTNDSINDYIWRMKQAIINKMEITEANGNTVIYEDDDSTPAVSVLAAYTTDSTTTTRKKLE